MSCIMPWHRSVHWLRERLPWVTVAIHWQTSVTAGDSCHSPVTVGDCRHSLADISYCRWLSPFTSYCGRLSPFTGRHQLLRATLAIHWQTSVTAGDCCHSLADISYCGRLLPLTGRHQQQRNCSVGSIITTLSELGLKNGSCFNTSDNNNMKFTAFKAQSEFTWSGTLHAGIRLGLPRMPHSYMIPNFHCLLTICVRSESDENTATLKLTL